MTHANISKFDYNAMAVAFMASGHYTEAMNALKTALLALNQAQRAPAADPGNRAMNNQAGPAAAAGPAMDVEMVQPATTATRAAAMLGLRMPLEIRSVRLLSYNDASAISPNNLFMLYASAFTVHPHVAEEISDAKWMAILLYNMAVATHLHALTNKPKDEACLRHVLDIYRSVMRAVYYNWEDEDRVWILMALACNAGHIHSHRLDFHSTRESLSLLLRLASQSVARTIVPPEDYQLFFDTVCIFMEGMDLAIAPAA